MSETDRGDDPRTERSAASLRKLLTALGLLFFLLVGLRVHGFSLATWHTLLGGSDEGEVLLGEARYIRADDWLVQLPLAFAQATHDPPFPRVNRNIGAGQNMMLPIVTPVARPSIALRPTQWGFFLGNDVGMAWLWWSQVLGLAAVWLVVFNIVTRGRVALSAAGSALVVATPFFQHWSFTKATIPIYAGLCFIAAVGVLSARSRRGIALHAVLLGWSGAAFVVVLYPPFQVPLVYLVLVLLAGWMLERRGEAPWQPLRGTRLLATGLACLGALAALALFYVDAREAIDLIRGTVYPGDRVSTGGDAPIWRLFTAHVATSLQVTRFRAIENIVEASSFWLMFPVVGTALLLERSRDPLALGLLGYCVAVLAYQVLGIPELAARATLVSFVPADRALLGLGLADVLLTLRYLSTRRGEASLSTGQAAAIAALWLIAVEAAGWGLMRRLPEMTLAATVGCAFVNAALAYALVLRLRPVRLVFAMAALMALTTLWFNPLARGGSDFLVHNPLSQRILEIDRQRPGGSVWLTYGNSDLANLMRMLGVRSYGGNLALPQLELWQTLDPGRRFLDVYNRYAHVGFLPPIEPGAEPDFQLTSHHAFAVHLDPESERMETLGVTHLLVRARARSEPYWSQFEVLDRVGRNLIFELPLRHVERK